MAGETKVSFSISQWKDLTGSVFGNFGNLMQRWYGNLGCFPSIS